MVNHYVFFPSKRCVIPPSKTPGDPKLRPYNEELELVVRFKIWSMAAAAVC